MAFGAAYADEDGGMNSIIDFGFLVPASYKLTRDSHAVFAEIGIDFIDKLAITAGIRHDKAEQLSVTTTRFIGQYDLNADTSVSFQFNEGFKLPSFFALAHPFVGNSELMPETSENYDISIERQFLTNKLLSRFSLYKNTYSDLVDFDAIAFTNVNRDRVRVQGVEVYLAFDASSQLHLTGQVSFNDIDTFEADTVLRRRPKLKASLLARYNMHDDLSVTGRYTVNDGYYDSSIPTGMVKMDGVSRVDLSGNWQVSHDLSLRLNINNVLDVDEEESIGFENSGRSMTLSLTKSL